MKKKISFKKMLDIGSIKQKQQKESKLPIPPKKTVQEIKKDKVEKKEVIRKTAIEDEKGEKKQENKKIVLFRLSNEYYGIEVSNIDEIIDTEVKEKLAGMPNFIAGVISLRNEIIPVISLFEKFQLKGRPIKETETVLITSKGNGTYGILIDELKEVIDVKSSSVFEVPIVFKDDEFSYLKGIINFRNEIAAILDIEQILKKYRLG